MRGRFFQAFHAAIRAAKHRREVRLLADMDERSLRDIGLLRADVRTALADRWHDPSRALKAICCHWQRHVTVENWR